VQFRIDGNPDYGDLTVALEPGERFLVESGAMSRMNRHMDLRGRMRGGLLGALGRKLFGGQSFFLGEYQSEAGGWLSLAPTLPGTVLHRRLEGESFMLTAGSFLGCAPTVDVRTRFGGVRALFSGEGAFLLECRGHGDLFFCTYGGIVEKDVDGELRVDTGHVVGWEAGLSYRIGGMGGLKQTVFSGEGLVMVFSGRGRIFLQTRTLGATAAWLTRHLPY